MNRNRTSAWPTHGDRLTVSVTYVDCTPSYHGWPAVCTPWPLPGCVRAVDTGVQFAPPSIDTCSWTPSQFVSRFHLAR